MAAEANYLDGLAIDHLADRMHALLLPDTVLSAEGLQQVADKLQQVAVHLQQKANIMRTSAHLSLSCGDITRTPDADTTVEEQIPTVATTQTEDSVRPAGKLTKAQKRKLGKARRSC